MPVELLINIISSPSCPADCQVYGVSSDMQEVIESFILYSHTSMNEQQLALTEGKACMGFMLDYPNSYCFLSGRKVRQHTEAYMSGTLLENTYLKKPALAQRLLLVRFTDRGLYQLLGRSLAIFRQQSSYCLQAIFGNGVTVLLADMKKVEQVEEKVRLIEQFFRKKVKHQTPIHPLLAKGLEIIRESRGRIRIEGLTEELEVNYKWLERNFQKYLGLSPKEFARNCRFVHAYSDLILSGTKDLLAIALNHGYYDEHHFVKDYRKFTGKTPVIRKGNR